MCFLIVLSHQCYSSWKLFHRKLIVRVLFIFLQLILSLASSFPLATWEIPLSSLLTVGEYTKVKVNPIALNTYLKPVCNNKHLSFVKTSSWALTLTILTIRRKCNRPAGKALFTIQLMRIFMKNLPSHFVKVGHQILACHLEHLIIFIAKQNVWLTQTLKI